MQYCIIYSGEGGRGGGGGGGVKYIKFNERTRIFYLKSLL